MAPKDVHSASQVALVVKNPPARAGDIRDVGSMHGSGRFPGGGHRNPSQYSCLENAMDRGVLRVTVHGVTESWTWLKWLSTYTCEDVHILVSMDLWYLTLLPYVTLCSKRDFTDAVK